MNGTPALSICIPTYNRAEGLAQALEALTCHAPFVTTSDVEIIISDNASTDRTQEVGTSFAKRFPSKVRYFRNAENQGAPANFDIVLRHATGRYLKLYNDYLVARPGALTQLLQVVQATANERPNIFLTNGNRRSQKVEVCSTADEFLMSVSYYCTWIAGFGLWREQLDQRIDFSNNPHQSFPQTDILFQLLKENSRTIVLNETYFLIGDMGRKRGYNVAEYFGRNLIHLLSLYVADGLIHADAFTQVKRDVLVDYILPNYFSTSNDLDKTGFFEHLQDYTGEPYFLPAVEKFILDAMRRGQAISA